MTAHKYPHTFCNEFCRSKWHSKNLCGTRCANYIHGKGNEKYPLEFNELRKLKKYSYKEIIENLDEINATFGNEPWTKIINFINARVVVYRKYILAVDDSPVIVINENIEN